MVKRGQFIVFEGLDGSGSSTQCELLKNYLAIRGIKAVVTKEPTNNLIGGLIRGILTHDWSLNPRGLQLLFSADRAHHLEKEVVPALKSGTWVICDRYFFSTIAFGSLECDYGWLKELNKYFLQPDLTVFLQVHPQECIKRIRKGRSRFELFEEEEKLKVVMQNYLKLSREYQNFNLINGNQPKEDISREIVLIVDRIIDSSIPFKKKTKRRFSQFF
ncbi:dTMP kinase [Candidatus Woesearchaeota archaeon]|nr:dTMP kinase [Candidatus Woesearchaeota archaeon]